MTRRNDLRQFWWTFKQSLKQCLPLTGVYAAIILGIFAYALNDFNRTAESQLARMGYYDASKAIDTLRIGVSTGILFLAVALGFLLFKYLYRREETDMFHSLPVKRKCMFWGKLAAGAVCLWFSVMLSGVLTAAMELHIMREPGGEAALWVWNNTLGEFGLMLLTVTAVFAFVVLAAVLANALFQGVMLLGAMTCIWPCVFGFATELIRSTIPEPTVGDFYSSFWMFLFSVFSPPTVFYTRAIRGGYDESINLQFLWWAFIAVALFLLAYKIYVNRKSLSSAASYGALKTSLSVLAAVAIALAAGFGAIAVSDNQVFFYLFSLLVGAAVFVGCQMLFFRRVKLSRKRLQPLVVVPVVFVCFCVAVSFGLGLDTARPKAEALESACIYDSMFYGEVRVEDSKIITGVPKEKLPMFFDLQDAVIESIRANEYPYRMGARDHEIGAENKQKINLSYTGELQRSLYGTLYKEYWIPKDSSDPVVQKAVGKALALRDAIARDEDYIKSLFPINTIDALSEVSGELWSPEGDKALTPTDAALAGDPEFRKKLEAALIADFAAGRMLTDYETLTDHEALTDKAVKRFTLWYTGGKSFTARGGMLDGTSAAGKSFRLDSSFDLAVKENMTETYALLEPLFT